MPPYSEHSAGFLTVSELTSELKKFVSGRFRDVRVEGEVSNAKLYPSGHFYFTLKDDLAMIRGVVFNYIARIGESQVVKDGERVVCIGRVDIYEKRGEYQLVVSNIVMKGDRGLLYIRFLELKEKLLNEGLFDEARKKPLPAFPTRIGIVTSPVGAAVRDMLRIISERFDGVSIQIYPATVQGEEAPLAIAEGIKYFNEAFEVDVIIVGRGGGSYEDLAPFNTEVVARAIFASVIPVVSAIGHEVDFTISDFVADVRAPTPSAAAAIIVPNRGNLSRSISNLKSNLVQGMSAALERAKYRLVREIMEFKDREGFFSSQRIYLDDLTGNLTRNLELYVRGLRTKCDTLAQRMADLNPFAILGRGYSIIVRRGTVVTDASQVKTDEELSVTLHRGGLRVTVKNKEY